MPWPAGAARSSQRPGSWCEHSWLPVNVVAHVRRGQVSDHECANAAMRRALVGLLMAGAVKRNKRNTMTFKLEAVRLTHDPDQTFTGVSTNLGISDLSHHRWTPESEQLAWYAQCWGRTSRPSEPSTPTKNASPPHATLETCDTC